MFALVFRFSAGRYHATPWGRHVNEADVAWPPEPWRILRTLIAAYWRKADRDAWPEDALADLIDRLAEAPPVYRLPERAVHAHSRHYMPAPVRTTLVFDAFARVAEDEPLVAAWPGLTLDPRSLALAEELATAVGYLGRAESWVDCTVATDWPGVVANCWPDASEDRPGETVRTIAPLPAGAYAVERARLLEAVDARERAAAAVAGRRPPTERALAKAQEKAFGATLPERLLDAIALETADLRKRGWNRPPASREILYRRPALGPTALRRSRPALAPGPARFTVARFVLAGRPRPRIEDAVRIGELMRLAVLSKLGWERTADGGRWRPKAPPEISGHGEDGRPLRDPAHAHAFWLPEDADDDGEIDHVVVHVPAGMTQPVREALDRVTKLWVEPGARRGADDENGGGARQEWRLALEGFGTPQDFASASRLLGSARRWQSIAPFLAAGHLKHGGHAAELRRLLDRRGGILAARAPAVAIAPRDTVCIHGRDRWPIHFHRFRSRGREVQHDALGAFLDVTFEAPVAGPLALGYGCHFGLGLFRRLE